jgi:hypothetical protein
VTEGVETEDNTVSSRGDWEGIDEGRVLHSNEKVIFNPSNIRGTGATRVVLKRRKRRMGMGSIFTAYTVGGEMGRRCFYHHNKYSRCHIKDICGGGSLGRGFGQSTNARGDTALKH